MTEKRFERIYADVDVFCRDHNAKGTSQLLEKEDYDTIVDLLNALHEENQELKQELHKIYKLATVNKVRDIVENVYDDLLYETTDESDYARKNVLKCLEEIDLLSDDLYD